MLVIQASGKAKTLLPLLNVMLGKDERTLGELVEESKKEVAWN